MTDLKAWAEALSLALAIFAFGGVVCLTIFACMVAM